MALMQAAMSSSGTNQAQRLQVYLRVRPAHAAEIDPSRGMSNIIQVLGDGGAGGALGQGSGGVASTAVSVSGKVYSFDRVYGPTQHNTDIYQSVMSNSISRVLDGFTATFICYGHTGTGKTHTMSSKQGKDPGVLFQAMKQLMQSCFGGSGTSTAGGEGPASKTSTVVHFTYVQLYRDNAQDLLNPDTPFLRLRRGGSGGAAGETTQGPSDSSANVGRPPALAWCDTTPLVDVSISPPITSLAQFMSLYEKADKHRVVAETQMNKQSSRGHSVLTVYVKRTVLRTSSSSVSGGAGSALGPSQSVTTVIGRSVFVDLAGYERMSKTMVEGIHKDEAKHINLSLSALASVIRALSVSGAADEAPPASPTKSGSGSTVVASGSSSSSTAHIPWRNSKLTMLLEPFLQGNSMTAIMLTLGPSSAHLTETVNTLHFGHYALQCKTMVKAMSSASVDYKREYELLLLRMKRMMEEGGGQQPGFMPTSSPMPESISSKSSSGGPAGLTVPTSSSEVDALKKRVQELEAVKATQAAQLEELQAVMDEAWEETTQMMSELEELRRLAVLSKTTVSSVLTAMGRSGNGAAAMPTVLRGMKELQNGVQRCGQKFPTVFPGGVNVEDKVSNLYDVEELGGAVNRDGSVEMQKATGAMGLGLQSVAVTRGAATTVSSATKNDDDDDDIPPPPPPADETSTVPSSDSSSVATTVSSDASSSSSSSARTPDSDDELDDGEPENPTGPHEDLKWEPPGIGYLRTVCPFPSSLLSPPPAMENPTAGLWNSAQIQAWSFIASQRDIIATLNPVSFGKWMTALRKVGRYQKAHHQRTVAHQQALKGVEDHAVELLGYVVEMSHGAPLKSTGAEEDHHALHRRLEGGFDRFVELYDPSSVWSSRVFLGPSLEPLRNYLGHAAAMSVWQHGWLHRQQKLLRHQKKHRASGGAGAQGNKGGLFGWAVDVQRPITLSVSAMLSDDVDLKADLASQRPGTGSPGGTSFDFESGARYGSAWKCSMADVASFLHAYNCHLVLSNTALPAGAEEAINASVDTSKHGGITGLEMCPTAVLEACALISTVPQAFDNDNMITSIPPRQLGKAGGTGEEDGQKKALRELLDSLQTPPVPPRTDWVSTLRRVMSNATAYYYSDLNSAGATQPVQTEGCTLPDSCGLQPELFYGGTAVEDEVHDPERLVRMWRPPLDTVVRTITATEEDFPRAYHVRVVGDAIEGSVLHCMYQFRGVLEGPTLVRWYQLSVDSARRVERVTMVQEGSVMPRSRQATVGTLGEVSNKPLCAYDAAVQRHRRDLGLTSTGSTKATAVGPTGSSSSGSDGGAIVAQSREEALSYLCTTQDVGCYLFVQVIPVRMDHQKGAPRLARSATPVLSLVPVIRNLRIGGAAFFGDEIYAAYDYDGGLEGPSIIRWFGSVEGIRFVPMTMKKFPEASLRIHTEWVHKYVRVQVVPVSSGGQDQQGSSKGNSVISKLVYVNLPDPVDETLRGMISRGIMAWRATRVLHSDDDDHDDDGGALEGNHQGVLFIDLGFGVRWVPYERSGKPMWAQAKMVPWTAALPMLTVLQNDVAVRRTDGQSGPIAGGIVLLCGGEDGAISLRVSLMLDAGDAARDWALLFFRAAFCLNVEGVRHETFLLSSPSAQQGTGGGGGGASSSDVAGKDIASDQVKEVHTRAHRCVTQHQAAMKSSPLTAIPTVPETSPTAGPTDGATGALRLPYWLVTEAQCKLLQADYAAMVTYRRVVVGSTVDGPNQRPGSTSTFLAILEESLMRIEDRRKKASAGGTVIARLPVVLPSSPGLLF